jgi:hypothetical protein
MHTIFMVEKYHTKAICTLRSYSEICNAKELLTDRPPKQENHTGFLLNLNKYRSKSVRSIVAITTYYNKASAPSSVGKLIQETPATIKNCMANLSIIFNKTIRNDKSPGIFAVRFFYRPLQQADTGWFATPQSGISSLLAPFRPATSSIFCKDCMSTTHCTAICRFMYGDMQHRMSCRIG